MDLMELRRALLQPHIKTIGGLPVLIDNAKYNSGNGKYNERLTIDSNYFITAWFDTETSDQKKYDLFTISGNPMYIRFYNDINATSVDYWSNGIFVTYGRFVASTVFKPKAEDFYLYCTTQQRYIIKGKNVP